MCYNYASVLCFGRKAHGALPPQPEMDSALPILEGKVLTTGPTGSPFSPPHFFLNEV